MNKKEDEGYPLPPMKGSVSEHLLGMREPSDLDRARTRCIATRAVLDACEAALFTEAQRRGVPMAEAKLKRCVWARPFNVRLTKARLEYAEASEAMKTLLLGERKPRTP